MDNENTNKTEQTGEADDKDVVETPKTIVDEAREERQALEKIREELKAEREALEKLRSDQILSGSTGEPIKSKPVELTPREYKDKVMSGEIKYDK